MEISVKDKIFALMKYIFKIIGYVIVFILIVVGLFLVFYFSSSTSAQKKGHKKLIGLYTIISTSMTPNINVYDVVLTYRVDDASTLRKGDVITFYSDNDFFGGTPITHRIIDVRNLLDGTVYVTKGDANQVQDSDYVYFNNIVGKVICKIPQLGRIQFFLASKSGWLIAILIPSLGIISYNIYKILKLILLKNRMLALQNKNGNI